MLKPHTIITSVKVKFTWLERLKILIGYQIHAVVHVHVDRDVRQIRPQKKIAYTYNPWKKEAEAPKKELTTNLRIVKNQEEE